MIKLIGLTDIYEGLVRIRIDHISAYALNESTMASSGSLIQLLGGRTIGVLETPEQIDGLLGLSMKDISALRKKSQYASGGGIDD